MATTQYLIRVKYENGNVFSVEQKIGDGTYVTIIEVEENGAIGALWSGVQIACENYWKHLITTIGDIMKA